MIRLSLFAALLVLTACSPPTRGYAPGVEQTFTRACESRSAVRGYCACVWTKIEANIAPGDFAALEQVSETQRQASPVMRQIEGYRNACLAQLQREPQTAP